MKVHRGRLMVKMQVRSVPELIQLAARVGIAPRRIFGTSITI